MNSSYMQQRRNNVPFVSASDMNKAIPPTIQKALYGIAMVSAMATAAIFFVAYLIHLGVIPASWVM